VTWPPLGWDSKGATRSRREPTQAPQHRKERSEAQPATGWGLSELRCLFPWIVDEAIEAAIDVLDPAGVDEALERAVDVLATHVELFFQPLGVGVPPGVVLRPAVLEYIENRFLAVVRLEPLVDHGVAYARRPVTVSDAPTPTHPVDVTIDVTT